MIRIAVLAFSLLLTYTSVKAADLKSYEVPRTEVVTIQENMTDRQYELDVKLPKDYSKNTDTKYPVIYTTDAVWHFEMLYGASEFLMPEVIVVGNSWQKNLDDERESVSRHRDYTMVESKNPELQAQYQLGQASNHLSFIRDEVIQYIENTYRADPAE